MTILDRPRALATGAILSILVAAAYGDRIATSLTDAALPQALAAAPPTATAPTKPAAPAAAAAPSTKLNRNWSLNPPIVRITGATDIYAMGDVHGDPDAQIRTLKAAGLVTGDAPYMWTGGKAVLVVTGDVIDKGSRSLQAIDNFRTIEADAAAKGGRVVVTMGNHEAEFLADPNGHKAEMIRKELVAKGLDPVKVAKGDSIYGAWLYARPVAAIVDEWFFSHAGNGEDRNIDELAGEFKSRFDAGNFEKIALDPLLEARKNWWGNNKSAIEDVLEALQAKHLVYGHQPGKIPCDPEKARPKVTLATCYKGLVFFLDVGMSSALNEQYGSDHRGGLLHIERGATQKVTAIHANGKKQSLWTGK